MNTRPAFSLRFQALNAFMRSKPDHGIVTDGLICLAASGSETNRKALVVGKPGRSGMAGQQCFLLRGGIEREPKRCVTHRGEPISQQ
jgi:hypothetical protein